MHTDITKNGFVISLASYPHASCANNTLSQRSVLHNRAIQLDLLFWKDGTNKKLECVWQEYSLL